MNEILSKPHYRRTFYVVVGLILVLSLVVRFFVLPHYSPAQTLTTAALIGSLLDNLVVSLFLAVFLGTFVFWLTPSIIKQSVIEVVEPKQINPLLKAASNGTRSWVYKGACGRYTRATTIPKLAEAARNESIYRDITICLLNPKNEAVCKAYATYRSGLKSGKPGSSGTPWTCQVVQEEIIATAVVALKYSFSEPQLRIRVFFVDHFSAFRLDISDLCVVVTKEDKEASALRADAGTYFYNSYKDDVRLTEQQSTEMKFCKELKFAGPVDEVKLKEVLECTSLFEVSKLPSLDITRLLNCINKPIDPY